MGCSQKIGGSYHKSNRKIIESVLSVASNLVKDVERLKWVEEKCQILKENLFVKQLTSSKQHVFAPLLHGYSITEIQDVLFKEENTIKNQRHRILQKLSSRNLSKTR